MKRRSFLGGLFAGVAWLMGFRISKTVASPKGFPDKKLRPFLMIDVLEGPTIELKRQRAWMEMREKLGRVHEFDGRRFIPYRAEIVAEQHHVHFDLDVVRFTFRVWGEELL